MNKTPDGPYRVIGETYQKWRVDPQAGLLAEKSSKVMTVDLKQAWFELERKSDAHVTIKLGETRVIPFKINHPDSVNAKYQVFVGAPVVGVSINGDNLFIKGINSGAGTIVIMLDYALFPQITGDYEQDKPITIYVDVI